MENKRCQKYITVFSEADIISVKKSGNFSWYIISIINDSDIIHRIRIPSPKDLKGNIFHSRKTRMPWDKVRFRLTETGGGEMSENGLKESLVTGKHPWRRHFQK